MYAIYRGDKCLNVIAGKRNAELWAENWIDNHANENDVYIKGNCGIVLIKHGVGE